VPPPPPVVLTGSTTNEIDSMPIPTLPVHASSSISSSSGSIAGNKEDSDRNTNSDDTNIEGMKISYLLFCI